MPSPLKELTANVHGSTDGTKYDEMCLLDVSRRSNEAKALTIIADLVAKVFKGDNEDELKLAMIQLYDLVNNWKTQKEFIQVDGHVAVVCSMTKHPDCLDLQSMGVCMLRYIVVMESEQAKSALVKVKGIEVILTAMQKFPLDKNILGNGLWILRSLTVLSCRDREANAHALVSEHNAVSLIIDAVNHLSNDSVRPLTFGDKLSIYNACSLLVNLAGIEHLRNSIRDANAKTALANIFEKFKDDTCIRKKVKELLKLLD